MRYIANSLWVHHPVVTYVTPKQPLDTRSQTNITANTSRSLHDRTVSISVSCGRWYASDSEANKIEMNVNTSSQHLRRSWKEKCVLFDNNKETMPNSLTAYDKADNSYLKSFLGDGELLENTDDVQHHGHINDLPYTGPCVSFGGTYNMFPQIRVTVTPLFTPLSSKGSPVHSTIPHSHRTRTRW